MFTPFFRDYLSETLVRLENLMCSDTLFFRDIRLHIKLGQQGKILSSFNDNSPVSSYRLVPTIVDRDLQTTRSEWDAALKSFLLHEEFVALKSDVSLETSISQSDQKIGLLKRDIFSFHISSIARPGQQLCTQSMILVGLRDWLEGFELRIIDPEVTCISGRERPYTSNHVAELLRIEWSDDMAELGNNKYL